MAYGFNRFLTTEAVWKHDWDQGSPRFPLAGCWQGTFGDQGLKPGSLPIGA